VAPCNLNTTSDYTVEAKIQVVHGNPCFALDVRGTTDANGWHGYQARICNGQATFTSENSNDIITSSTFDPGTNFHTYRIEAKGTQLKLFIDGGLELTGNDNRYLSGNQIGLRSNSTQLTVSSFTINPL
jgi:hypothetical protein